MKENVGGWLVRTKGKDVNEDGMTSDLSVLNSLVLIDSNDQSHGYIESSFYPPNFFFDLSHEKM